MPPYQLNMLFLILFLFMSAALAGPQSVLDRPEYLEPQYRPVLVPDVSRPKFPKPPQNSTDRCAKISFELQSKVYPHPNGCVIGKHDRCCCEFGDWVEVGVSASSRSSRTPATKTTSYACCHGDVIEQNGYRACPTAAVIV